MARDPLTTHWIRHAATPYDVQEGGSSAWYHRSSKRIVIALGLALAALFVASVVNSSDVSPPPAGDIPTGVSDR